MTNKKKSDAFLLRQKAEDELAGRMNQEESPLSNTDLHQVIHELQVHQVELMMQNEELTKAKEESEAARIKYADLYDFAPAGYFTLNQEGEILQLNLCASKMVGKGRSLLIHSRLGFFISDDTKSYFSNFLHNIFKYQINEYCEITFLPNDSDPIFVQLNGTVTEDGELCLVTAVNITQRKIAEIALQENQKLYADLVSNQSSGVYRIRVDKPEENRSLYECTSFEFVNDQFCKLFGIENSGNLDRVLRDCFVHIHPDYSELFTQSHLNAIKTMLPYQFEIKLIIDGSPRWITLEATPRLLENGASIWTGIGLDITEKKVAEEAIRISEEKYRMLIELASDAFFHGDSNGDFITVNSIASVYTGYTREELLMMNMKDLFSEHTLQNSPLKYKEAQIGEIILSERELVRKDGTKILVEMKSKMMPDGTYQSFFRDITEKKRTDNALKQKLHEMEIYYELAVTRERKMITLKSEVNLLLARLGESLKY